MNRATRTTVAGFEKLIARVDSDLDKLRTIEERRDALEAEKQEYVDMRDRVIAASESKGKE